MKRLRKSDIEKIDRLAERLSLLRDSLQLDERDLPLSHGNGSVVEQLGCALCALDCILQEHNPYSM